LNKKKGKMIIQKQAQKLDKKRGKWRRSRIYRVWFRIYFDPTMWVSSKHQYFIGATLAPKVANWPPKLIDTLFFFFSFRAKSGP
jgi:hypothetical protein